MAVEQQFLNDFSGGEIYSIASTEPKENQWLLIKGLVLDQNGRLRAQWSGVVWDVEESGS